MERFIDGIGAIRITNGLVRIQTTRSMQNQAGETVIQDRGELVLNINTFLQLQGSLNNAIEQMIERGILTRREDAQVEAQQQTPAEPDIDLDAVAETADKGKAASKSGK